MKRRLSLSRETLAELTSDELAGLAGAALPGVPALPTKPVNDCYQKFVTPMPTNSPMCIS